MAGRNIVITDRAFDDLVFWSQTDKKIIQKIFEIIKDIQRDPFKGLGKPEPLKSDLSGYWSRRINDEHRLIYSIDKENMFILSCRYHYK